MKLYQQLALSKEQVASLMQQGAMKVNPPEPRQRGARGPAPGCGGGPRKFETEEERIEARKQYVRDYRTKHWQRLNEYSREWKRQNRERVKRVKREYNLKLKADKLTPTKL